MPLPRAKTRVRGRTGEAEADGTQPSIEDMAGTRSGLGFPVQTIRKLGIDLIIPIEFISSPVAGRLVIIE